VEVEDNNTSKERILMVHNFYQIGGGEHTVFANEKRLLSENGHYLVEYTRDNAELNKSKIKKLLLPFSSIFSFKTYREVKKIIKREKIDIVHCHNTFPLISPSVYYAARKCKVPVVQTIHNFRFLCPNGVFYRDGHTCEDCLNKGLSCSLKNRCYRNSKIQTLVVVNMLRFHRLIGTYKKINYIFLTDFNKTKYDYLLKGQAVGEYIKPNFEYIDLPEKVDECKDIYVFIGRLEENKGIRFLLESWKKIDKELFIFGDGTYKNEVEDASVNYPNIHYLGFKPQNEVFEYIARAKALIFPSEWYEGFPMSLIEAFALETPVLCADIGNQADIVKSAKAGAVYKLGDKSSFIAAIDDIEVDFIIYSKNARAAYETQYTPQANYKQLKSIYEAIRK